ncbi:MAG: hypothetical protein M3503_00430 [Actinomycetota bacterium]|nr:hypothetical protein [Actinomycetota bacterium]
MKLYADDPRLARRQGSGDALLLAWVIAWVEIGQRLTSLVDRLGGPGRTLATAGGRLEDGLRGAAGGVGRLPVVGGGLEDVFSDTAGAGTALREAGVEQAEVAHQLAVALGLIVAGLAIAWALARHLPGRIRWIRDAGAARSLVADAADLRLFALRAVVNQPLYELRRVSADPGADLAAGRFDRLAALELAALGLDLPAPPRRGGGAAGSGVRVP